MSHQVPFGITLRDKKRKSDDDWASRADVVLDALDEVVGDEYDYMAWSRAGVVYVAIRSDIKARSVLLHDDVQRFFVAEVIPITEAMREMDSLNNEWLSPRPNSRSNDAPGEIAAKMMTDWLSTIWDDSVEAITEQEPAPEPKDKPEPRKVREVPKADDRSRRKSRLRDASETESVTDRPDEETVEVETEVVVEATPAAPDKKPGGNKEQFKELFGSGLFSAELMKRMAGDSELSDGSTFDANAIFKEL